MRIVVIGGVAAGMSAASQAKRRRPDAELVVLERGRHVSYGACGLPYNIADPERRIDDLVVITAEQFRNERGIDVRTGHEVLAIDVARKLVRVRDIEADREYELPYDRLVIATGASAVRLPLSGIDLPGVFPLRELGDGAAIKGWIEERKPKRAAIVGFLGTCRPADEGFRMPAPETPGARCGRIPARRRALGGSAPADKARASA